MPEIERKFKLSCPPPREVLGSGQSVCQVYLATAPVEIRLRRAGARLTITAKGDGGLVREEWEAEIPLWLYEAALASTARIDKIRYCADWDGYTLEVDEFLGRHAGLYLLECEFASSEEAAEFTLPPWAADAQEVTDDPPYKNKHLALA